MEKKLTIAHLAPYLPYGLTFMAEDCDSPFEIFGLNVYSNTVQNVLGEGTFYLDQVKPLLRPLSDLDKEISWNYKGADYGKLVKLSNNGFFRSDLLKGFTWDNIKNGHFDFKGQRYYHEISFAHHFDVFNLIEQGLALPK